MFIIENVGITILEFVELVPLLALIWVIFYAIIKWRKNYRENRPKMGLKGLSLDSKKVKIFRGKDVEGWEDTKLITNQISALRTEKYIDIVADSGRLCKSKLLYPHEHGIPKDENTYMFINLCSEEDVLNHKDDVILAFGVLNIKLALDLDKISKLEIHRVYSMKGERRSFNKNIKIDVMYDKLSSPLTIPVAYACLNDTDTSLHLLGINELKNKRNKKKSKHNPIHFLRPHVQAGKYIGFLETAYLIKCTTHSGTPYYYSILLQKANKVLKPPKERYGKTLFYVNAIKASIRARRIVIQKSVKRSWHDIS